MAKKAKALTNMIDAGKAENFFKQYEDLEVERLSRHSSYMADMKSLREDKREVRTAAKDAGIPMIVFDAEIAERAWARKREERLNQILAIEDMAMMWRELRKHFQEDVHFIPENPPKPAQKDPELGPDEEVEEEEVA